MHIFIAYLDMQCHRNFNCTLHSTIDPPRLTLIQWRDMVASERITFGSQQAERPCELFFDSKQSSWLFLKALVGTMQRNVLVLTLVFCNDVNFKHHFLCSIVVVTLINGYKLIFGLIHSLVLVFIKNDHCQKLTQGHKLFFNFLARLVSMSLLYIYQFLAVLYGSQFTGVLKYVGLG